MPWGALEKFYMGAENTFLSVHHVVASKVGFNVYGTYAVLVRTN